MVELFSFVAASFWICEAVKNQICMNNSTLGSNIEIFTSPTVPLSLDTNSSSSILYVWLCDSRKASERWNWSISLVFRNWSASSIRRNWNCSTSSVLSNWNCHSPKDNYLVVQHHWLLWSVMTTHNFSKKNRMQKKDTRTVHI